jgi:hypothetical protein
MRKTLLIVFSAAFVWTSWAQAAQPKLVASDSSDRYHLASCKIALKIYPDERLNFVSPEEAVAAGLVPCKKCDPPASSSVKD